MLTQLCSSLQAIQSTPARENLAAGDDGSNTTTISSVRGLIDSALGQLLMDPEHLPFYATACSVALQGVETQMDTKEDNTAKNKQKKAALSPFSLDVEDAGGGKAEAETSSVGAEDGSGGTGGASEATEGASSSKRRRLDKKNPTDKKDRNGKKPMREETAKLSYPKQLFETLVKLRDQGSLASGPDARCASQCTANNAGAVGLCVPLLGAYLEQSLPTHHAVARIPKFTVCVEFCNITAGFALGTNTPTSLSKASRTQLQELHATLCLIVKYDVYNETADNMEGHTQLHWFQALAKQCVEVLIGTAAGASSFEQEKHATLFLCLCQLIQLNHLIIEPLLPQLWGSIWLWDHSQLHTASKASTQFACDLLMTYGRLRQIDTLLVSMFEAAAMQCKSGRGNKVPISFNPTIQCTWAQCFQALPDGQVSLIWGCFLTEITSNAEEGDTADEKFKWRPAFVLASDVFCVFLNHVVVTMQNCPVHEEKLGEMNVSVLQPLDGLEELAFALDTQMLKSCLSLTLAVNELGLVVWRMYSQFLSKPLELQSPKYLASIPLILRSKKHKSSPGKTAQVRFWNFQSDIQRLCFSSAQLSAELQGSTRDVSTNEEVPAKFRISSAAAQVNIDILINTVLETLERSKFQAAEWSGHPLDIVDEATLGVAVWHHFVRVFPPFQNMCTAEQLAKVALCVVATYGADDNRPSTDAITLQETTRTLTESAFFQELGQIQIILVQMAASEAMSRVIKRVQKTGKHAELLSELTALSERLKGELASDGHALGDIDVDLTGLLSVLALVQPDVLAADTLSVLFPAVLMIDYALNTILLECAGEKKSKHPVSPAALISRIGICRKIVWRISCSFPRCVVGTLLVATRCTLHAYIQNLHFLLSSVSAADVSASGPAPQALEHTVALVRVFFHQAALLDDGDWDDAMKTELQAFIKSALAAPNLASLTADRLAAVHQRSAFTDPMSIVTAVFEGISLAKSPAATRLTLEQMLHPLAAAVRGLMEAATAAGVHCDPIIKACVVVSQSTPSLLSSGGDFEQNLVARVCGSLIASCSGNAVDGGVGAQALQCLQHLDAMATSICTVDTAMFCRTIAALLHTFSKGLASQSEPVVAACSSIFSKLNTEFTVEQRHQLFEFMNTDLHRASRKLFCLHTGASTITKIACTNRIEAVLRVWKSMQITQSHQAIKMSFYHVQLDNLTNTVYPLVQYLGGTMLVGTQEENAVHGRIQDICHAGFSAIQTTLNTLNSANTGLSSRSLSTLLLLLGCDTHVEKIAKLYTANGFVSDDGKPAAWHEQFTTKYNILEGLVRLHSKAVTSCIALFAAAIRPLMTSLLLLDHAHVLDADVRIVFFFSLGRCLRTLHWSSCLNVRECAADFFKFSHELSTMAFCVCVRLFSLLGCAVFAQTDAAEEACRSVARLQVQFATLAGAGKHTMHIIADYVQSQQKHMVSSKYKTLLHTGKTVLRSWPCPCDGS